MVGSEIGETRSMNSGAAASCFSAKSLSCFRTIVPAPGCHSPPNRTSPSRVFDATWIVPITTCSSASSCCATGPGKTRPKSRGAFAVNSTSVSLDHPKASGPDRPIALDRPFASMVHVRNSLRHALDPGERCLVTGDLCARLFRRLPDKRVELQHLYGVGAIQGRNQFGLASCGHQNAIVPGSAGKVTNCQIGVFAAYVSRHGHAFIDRALYLPRTWTNDAARLAVAQVPPEVHFATKLRLAIGMIERALCRSAGWRVTTLMVVARSRGRCGGVKATDGFSSWIGKPPVSGTAEAIAQGLAPSAWQRLSAGDGTKGARLYDWAYLALADLEAAEFDPTGSGLWTRGLLIRRTIADGERAYFSTWCPAGTTIETLVRRGGPSLGGVAKGSTRDARGKAAEGVEDGFETAKTELGLDHNGQAARDRLTVLGTAGTGMSRWSCWPLPCWRRSATAPIAGGKNQRPRLRRQIQTLGPLVGAGNPSHRRASRTAAH